MNAMIRAGARRGSRPGLLDRLRGASPLDNSRQERLNTQMVAYEDAARRGDPIAAQIADEKIEELLTEARAARQQASSAPDAPQAPPSTSFDGGVRRRSASTRQPPNMNRVILGAAAERRAIAAAARDSV